MENAAGYRNTECMKLWLHLKSKPTKKFERDYDLHENIKYNLKNNLAHYLYLTNFLKINNFS